MLGQFAYQDLVPGPIDLPPRPSSTGYKRPPRDEQTFVPDHYPKAEE